MLAQNLARYLAYSLLWAVTVGSLLPAQEQSSPTQVPAASTYADSLQRGLAALTAENYLAAAEELSKLIAEAQLEKSVGPSEQQLFAAKVGAGQALRHLGRHREALDYLESALTDLTDERAAIPLRLAAAASASAVGEHLQASRYCQEILVATTDEGAIAQARRILIVSLSSQAKIDVAWEHFQQLVQAEGARPSQLHTLALGIAYAGLQHEQYEATESACTWLQQRSLTDAQLEATEVASAWAALQQAGDARVAEERLQGLLQRYPNGEQRPRVLLAYGSLLLRRQQNDQAVACFHELVEKYPQSKEVSVATEYVLALRPDLMNDRVDTEFLREAIAKETVGVTTLARAFVEASQQEDARLWREAVSVLRGHDGAQRELNSLLNELESQTNFATAGRLAIELLTIREAEQDKNLSLEPIFSQTCRWLAERGEWVALCEATIWVNDSVGDRLQVASLRLIAESRIQRGMLSDAKPLIDFLINKVLNRDFDTLLRRAEIDLALESKEVAATSISEALAAASASDQQALVRLLQCQWLIRDARMDEARILLKQVKNEITLDVEVKARAQWMMGETFFLQRQYAEAVNEYRAVPALDSKGIWAAAAMLQAGRAFEQLGRRTEAAICYTNLLKMENAEMFFESARDRLAQLGPESNIKSR